MEKRIAFIGGGNMASAIIGRLIAQGASTGSLVVLEPLLQAREQLESTWAIETHAQASTFLSAADMVLWAIKPQVFHEATRAICQHTRTALHLSVAAGIRSQNIAQWLGSDRVIRAMPNTPAFIGKGITGLYARCGVSMDDKEWVNHVLGVTGVLIWLDQEDLLDAVTALSGSGPAYVFYFMEAMIESGMRMGLSYEQARLFAVSTFTGAGELALATTDTLQTLRQRVTSKGGTTHAALARMEATGVKELFSQAIFAAQHRAQEMSEELRS